VRWKRLWAMIRSVDRPLCEHVGYDGKWPRRAARLVGESRRFARQADARVWAVHVRSVACCWHPALWASDATVMSPRTRPEACDRADRHRLNRHQQSRLRSAAAHPA
jgi:hypothetical protein